MSWSTATYLLTAFAAVVVVLTRVRLAGAGAARGSGLLLRVHTVVGGLAVVLWTGFLLTGDDLAAHDLVGLAGLGCWWVTALVGLGLLARWLPSRGRHAEERSQRSRSGAALAALAHLGLATAAVVFTWAYLTSAV